MRIVSACFFSRRYPDHRLHLDTHTPHMPDWLSSLLHWLAMPEAGLGALLVVTGIRLARSSMASSMWAAMNRSICALGM